MEIFFFVCLDGYENKAEIIAKNMCVTQESIRTEDLYYPHTEKKSEEDKLLRFYVQNKNSYFDNLRSNAVSNDGSLVDE